MRFATRAFLWSFGPFALLLFGSFWNVQKLVQLTVRDNVRTSLRHTHDSIAYVRSKNELRNSRFLRMVGENASLKAGLQLLNANHQNAEARLTVEDQLREIADSLAVDFLLVSDPEGRPEAGVMRVDGQMVNMDVARVGPPLNALFGIEQQVYQVASTPINQGDENLGALTIGERFSFSGFDTPAVLMHQGHVLTSSIPGLSEGAVESAIRGCPPQRECEVRLAGENYLSLPLEDASFRGGYELRTLQSLDATTRPLQHVLQHVFLITGVGTLLATVILTLLCSRSIVKPIAGVIARLRETQRTGRLPEFESNTAAAPIHEIRELTESFNHAGRAIREAQENLHGAYVEFIGSLANALDARDPYTAGHSLRVSEYSCAIARTLGLPEQSVDEIRIGAILHDIGKIGIADLVLQKSGKLSPEEWALIQQHPTIGRRILEGVGGFQIYLPTVELHHENWDGTGYPFGLRGESVPLPARIVHIADAYDAMTSSRPYRHAMSRGDALGILHQNAGTQFDPAVVPVFVDLMLTGPVYLDRIQAPDSALRSIQDWDSAILDGSFRREGALA